MTYCDAIQTDEWLCFYDPPDRTMYLSGVVSPGLLEHADRPDIGLLIQPGTASSYYKYIGNFGLYGADNGCFSKGDDFDEHAWINWVATLPDAECLFVVAPDVVGDARATWRRSKPWLPEIRALGLPAALVAQDGIEHMRIDWDSFDTLFIGGSTEWKLSPVIPGLIAEAQRQGKWTHMGRVNSAKRLRWASRICRADSVDGTCLAYGPAKVLPRLLGWLDQFAEDLPLTEQGS